MVSQAVGIRMNGADAKVMFFSTSHPLFNLLCVCDGGVEGRWGVVEGQLQYMTFK